MKQKDYLNNQEFRLLQNLENYSKGKITEDDISNIEEQLNIVKFLFYSSDSKWSLMKCFSFNLRYNLKPGLLLNYLEELFSIRFSVNPKGKKSAFALINSIKTSRKFNKIKSTKPKLFYYDTEEYESMIQDLINFKNLYLKDISQNKWLDHIHQCFDTGKTKTTFRFDYSYQNKLRQE